MEGRDSSSKCSQLVQQLRDCLGTVDHPSGFKGVLHLAECFLEDGLVGNRSITDVWSLIRKTSAAYPLLLNDVLERVMESSNDSVLRKQQLQQKWIMQAIYAGKLGAFVKKVPQQPHIKTAYLLGAPILHADMAEEWCQLVDTLQQHPAFMEEFKLAGAHESTFSSTTRAPAAELGGIPPFSAGALSSVPLEPTARVELSLVDSLCNSIAGSCEELTARSEKVIGSCEEPRVQLRIVLLPSAFDAHINPMTSPPPLPPSSTISTDAHSTPDNSTPSHSAQHSQRGWFSRVQKASKLSSVQEAPQARGDYSYQQGQLTQHSTGNAAEGSGGAVAEGAEDSSRVNSPSSAKGDEDAVSGLRAWRAGPHPVVSWGMDLFQRVLAHRSLSTSGEAESKVEDENAGQGADGVVQSSSRGTDVEQHTQSDSTSKDIVSTVDPSVKPADQACAEGKAACRTGRLTDTDNAAAESQSADTDSEDKDDTDKGGKDEGTADNNKQAADKGGKNKVIADTYDKGKGAAHNGKDVADEGKGAAHKGKDEGKEAVDKDKETVDHDNEAIGKDDADRQTAETDKASFTGASVANRWLGNLFRRTQQVNKKQELSCSISVSHADSGPDAHAADGSADSQQLHAEEERQEGGGEAGSDVRIAEGGQGPKESLDQLSGPLASGRLISGIGGITGIVRRSTDSAVDAHMLRLTLNILQLEGELDSELQGPGVSGRRLVEVKITLIEEQRLEHHVREWSQAAAQVAVGAVGVIAQQAAHRAPILWQYIREHAEQHLLVVPPNAGNRGRDGGGDNSAVEHVPVEDMPEFQAGLKEAAECAQKLQACVLEVVEAGSSRKGMLGDECTALINLCQMLEKVLHHGLRPDYQWTQHWFRSQPLLSWIPTPRPHPFAMLGDLQKGRKQPKGSSGAAAAELTAPDPPVDLGVDGIHAMRMAAGAADSTKLQLWIRVSLNQQLLGKRMQLLVDFTHRKGSWKPGGALANNTTTETAIAATIGPTTAATAATTAENGVGDSVAADAPVGAKEQGAKVHPNQLSGWSLDAWYQPWALLRQEALIVEAVEQLQQLDGIRSLLAVDVQSVQSPPINAISIAGEGEAGKGAPGSQFAWPISPNSTFSEPDSTATAAPAVLWQPSLRAPSLARSSTRREPRMVEIQTGPSSREAAFSPRSSGGVLSPVSSTEFNMELDIFDQLAADMDLANTDEAQAAQSSSSTHTSGLKLPSLELLSFLQPELSRKDLAHRQQQRIHATSPAMQGGGADAGSGLNLSSHSLSPAAEVSGSHVQGTHTATQPAVASPAGAVPLAGTAAVDPDQQQREASQAAVQAALSSLTAELPLEGVALVPEVLAGRPISAEESNPLQRGASGASIELNPGEERRLQETGSREDGLHGGEVGPVGVVPESSQGPHQGGDELQGQSSRGLITPLPPTLVLLPTSTAPGPIPILTNPAISGPHPTLTTTSASSNDFVVVNHPQGKEPGTNKLCNTTASPSGPTHTPLSPTHSPPGPAHPPPGPTQPPPSPTHTPAVAASVSAGPALVPAPSLDTLRMSSLSVVSSHTLKDSKGGDFTVYAVDVGLQDGTKYQVQHRFSDFVNLRHSLKYNMGAVLPESWSDISKARHVTGRARISSEVVHARRAMLDKCLRDLLRAPPALLRSRLLREFLAPQSGDALLHSHSDAAMEASTNAVAANNSFQADTTENAHSTIRLLFDMGVGRSPADQLKTQKGRCAGCQSPLPPLDDSYSLWRQGSTRSPRLCHYTHMLYCNNCHHGHMHSIPARILHKWDFTRHPVCLAVHEYLQAIHHQPMICVTTVNPGLYARVPTMAKAYEQRYKTVKTLELAGAAGPEAATKAQRLLEAAGQRAYLLEKADFWSLRDLLDISKGAFSELPHWLETAGQRASAIATASVLSGRHASKP